MAWAQVEFAPLGAEWYYRFNPGYFSTNSVGFSHVQYIGDTVLDGRVCKQICTTNYSYPVSLAHCNSYSDVDYIFQSADSILRYESYPTGNFKLLFRNNFQLGDTFQTKSGRQWVVTEITGLDFNNSTVRRFKLEANGGATFIYDLFGPESGILERLPDEIADVATFNLRCYADANFAQVNLTGEACNEILNSPEPGFELIISPNPVHDIIQLEFRGFLSGPPMIRMWDEIGRVVFEALFDFGQQQLDVSKLPAGFYEMTAEVDDKVVRQKFIKY